MQDFKSNGTDATLQVGQQTEGVKILLGDPRKAVVKLSIPMIAAMSAHNINHLVDAIWVSGRGPESLSAVGFTFPFLFLAIAIAAGIGIGGGAAISRKIGARDKEAADNIAAHTIVLTVICAALFTIAMLLFAERAMRLMHAGAALDLAVTYAKIMFAGVIFMFFTQVATALLRSEGDAKRAMYAMVGGAALNIVLDPIFIYTLDMGVAGAAVATIISTFIVSIFAFYWLFLEKKMHISFPLRGFRFDREVLADISSVGFPVAVSHMSMALTAFALTTIVASVGGSDGVAVYITGWRIISMAVLPMLGVASAVTAVAGAAYGAKEYEKIKISYMYALKLGVLVESVLAIATFVFAEQITRVFTWSDESTRIVDDLVQYLRVIWVIFPAVAFGMLSSAMFQGVGKGLYSLIMTLIRTLVFTVPCAWLFGVLLQRGLLGVWIGMALGGLFSIPIAFGWAVHYMRKLIRREDRRPDRPIPQVQE